MPELLERLPSMQSKPVNVCNGKGPLIRHGTGHAKGPWVSRGAGPMGLGGDFGATPVSSAPC